jgi:hypothetical protein
MLVLALLHCGGAVAQPNDGGVDVAPSPPPPCVDPPLGLFDQPADFVAVQGANVYFSSSGLTSLPKDGGGQAVDIAPSCWPFVLDGGRAICAVHDATTSTWSLASVALEANGAQTVIATNVPQPQTLLVDETNIYVLFAFPSQTLGVIPKSGGSPTTIAAAHDMQLLAVDATAVYWATDDDVYATPTETINATTKDGAQTTTLASFGGHIGGYASDATTLYFTYYDPATVTAELAKMPLSGGPITKMLDVSASSQHIVAVDDWAVYVSAVSHSSDGIVSVPLDGEPMTPTHAYAGTRGFGGVALDDRYIYYAQRGEIGGSLARVCK